VYELLVRISHLLGDQLPFSFETCDLDGVTLPIFANAIVELATGLVCETTLAEGAELSSTQKVQLRTRRWAALGVRSLGTLSLAVCVTRKAISMPIGIYGVGI
jgi:hypothetical protein